MHFDNPTRLAVAIPAYKPSRGLIDLVRTLADKGFPAIVIVDDGSGPEFSDVFSAVAELPNVRLLRHAVNLGKGAALKTAFNYVLCEFPEATGVVTADADGQHHPDDIESVAERLIERPECLVLGSRQFGAEVPLRSRIGNIATRGIMHALLGRKLTDTQTGLRGIPASLLPRLMRLESTGYEFELEMLMAAHHLPMTMVEEPIRTIYEPGNKSSHFNPVIDSMKIYFVLLRFSSISLITALIDNLIFILMRRRGMDILPAQILGRAAAVAFNYSMVRSSVFYSRQEHRAVLPKYLTLVMASGAASYAGIRALSSNFGIDPIPAKLMVETFLFFVNFAVQRLFIFTPRVGDRPREAAGKAGGTPRGVGGRPRDAAGKPREAIDARDAGDTPRDAANKPREVGGAFEAGGTPRDAAVQTREGGDLREAGGTPREAARKTREGGSPREAGYQPCDAANKPGEAGDANEAGDTPRDAAVQTREGGEPREAGDQPPEAARKTREGGRPREAGDPGEAVNARGDESRRQTSLAFASIAGLAFLALIGLEWHGFRTEHLFQQEIWLPLGLKRFAHYGAGYLALAVPLLMIVPWAFAGFVAALLSILTALAVGPQAVLATGFFLLSACALGSKVLRAKEDSLEDHLLATLLGAGVYIFLMTLLARQPVNYPWLWGGLLAVPLLLDIAGARQRFHFWLRLFRTAELRSVAERAAFAAFVFILVAHWFTALKPESSADGLAMHLAVPMEIAINHRMTFEPARFVWSVMPMGADWCYTIVNLLGGEYAAHLLVWCMLAILAALLYSVLRRLVTSAAAFLLIALFLATPLVQLVTGSLFVENVLAAMVFGMVTALWRFSETGARRYLYLAMWLAGTAMAVKIGALAFVALALIYAIVEIARHWGRLGPRAWAVCVLAPVLLLAAAVPTYAIAYAKTGNPLFPFLNRKHPSPLLDPTVDFADNRYRKPVGWNTLYEMTFHTPDYYEGQKGSLGFQHLVMVPLALLALLVVRSRVAVTAALIGTGAAILILRSEPNARYAYSSLPLITVAFAGFLGWAAAHQRWLYRAVMLFLVASTALNAWFLPSSSYYHKEWALRTPFSRAERERHLREATPVRDVIAYFNRAHAGAGVLFTHNSDIAGTRGDIYENHWHQWSTFDRILKAPTVPALLDLLKTWKVEYFILQKPAPGLRMWSKELTRLIEACTVPEYERGDTYLARLKPACDVTTPAAQPPTEPTIVARPGFYDDFDPAIVFRGEWERDETFAEPARHTVSYTDASGAEAAFAFEGTALTWMFTKAPNRGIAEVTVDGIRKEPVDLYSPGIEWQTQARYCCFTPGRHVVVIRVTGKSHAKSTGRFVDVDSFIVE